MVTGPDSGSGQGPEPIPPERIAWVDEHYPGLAEQGLEAWKKLVPKLRETDATDWEILLFMSAWLRMMRLTHYPDLDEPDRVLERRIKEIHYSYAEHIYGVQDKTQGGPESPAVLGAIELLKATAKVTPVQPPDSEATGLRPETGAGSSE